MFVTSIIDFIFPPSTETLLVRNAETVALTARCVPTLHEGVTALLSFSDPLVRACVHEAKFHGNKKAMSMLGAVLRQYLNTLPPLQYTIIPVPLSRKRKRDRGYNQVSEMVKCALGASTSYTLNEHLLGRMHDTRPQTDLPREKRLQNVQGAFRAAQGASLEGVHLLLIDDVVTSGATLRAAKAALLPLSPASLRLIALAH